MKIEDLHYSLLNVPVDEENFDLEKWRRENPMDYLKALYLVLSSGDWVPGIQNHIAMAVSFKAIYKLTRLYIPDTLYKFYSLTDDCVLDKKKFTTLENRKIFMSNIKDFNDPFDGKAFFYNPEELKGIKRLESHNGWLIDDFTVFHRGTALTENDTNCMPMWAHYSNNHQGFCVAYDMKESGNLALSSCTFPIQYTDQCFDITSFMKKYANMVESEIDKQTLLGSKKIVIKDLSLVYVAQYLCNIKHLSWKYEKEFRCTMGAVSKGMPFVDAIPKAVYIGMNCSKKNRQRLIKIAKKLSVPIYQMKFDELSDEYALVADLLET